MERRLEWFLMRRTSHYDLERRETIATIDSPILGIESAEVLHDSRGFVAPALDPDRAWRATLLRIQYLGAKLQELEENECIATVHNG